MFDFKILCLSCYFAQQFFGPFSGQPDISEDCQISQLGSPADCQIFWSYFYPCLQSQPGNQNSLVLKNKGIIDLWSLSGAKICDDKFGSCKKSFSRLSQNINKKIDVYGHDADDSGMDLCPWPRDDAIHLDTIQYSDRI